VAAFSRGDVRSVLAKESVLGYTWTVAVRLYQPLVNERAKKCVEARLTMQQACESHYAAVFARKIS
jgi:hypothetical protein